jgi:phosphoglycolate phosphatase
VDLFVFDLDGTLVDSSRDISDSLNFSLTKVGLPAWPVEEIRTAIGNGSRLLLEEALRGHEERLEEAFGIFSDHYAEHLLDHTRLYPGVRETLEALAGVKLAVLSNKRQIYCDPIIDGLGVRSFFGCVVGGDLLPYKKPRPEPLLHICTSMGILPARTAMVGDSPVDVETARNAGAISIGVTGGFAPAEEILRARPDLTVQTVAAIGAQL